MPFVNKYGAIGGMVCGHAISLWVSVGGLFISKPKDHLPYSTLGCSESVLAKVANITLIMNSTVVSHDFPL